MRRFRCRRRRPDLRGLPRLTGSGVVGISSVTAMVKQVSSDFFFLLRLLLLKI